MIGFAEMLVDCGIDSISLNPDSVLKVRQRIAKHEALKTTKTIDDSKSFKVKEVPQQATKHRERSEAQ